MSAARRTTGIVLLTLMTASIGWTQSVTLENGKGVLTSLQVPGGTSALARSAGLDDAGPRGNVLLDVIRVVYESPGGADAARDERRGRLREYLGALSDFERARGALRDGQISASLAQSKAPRRAVEDFARAIGGTLDENRGVFRLALSDDDGPRRRRQCLQDAGVDLATLTRDFNSGATVTVTLPSDDVPLPLDVQAWTRLVTPAPELSGTLLTALLSDRRASLLYYGLMGIDGPTRAYLGSMPPLLDKLLEGPRPSVMATFGRSIRIRAGRVDVPGGARAIPLWEALVDERISDPQRFILELVNRDRGRIAVLYDAIDHLDAPRQAFALGLRATGAGRQVERFRALYAAVETALTAWDVEARPFTRTAYDPVHLLTATRVLPSGELPAPAGRLFWQTALASLELPREPARYVEIGEPDLAADAAWLVGQTCVPNAAKRQQFVSLWLFGQRVFTGLEPTALPDALVALRGFTRFRTLLLTLDRMGITDPAIYAATVRQAQRLSDIGNREVASTSLRQFQSALALVERVRFSRAISVDVARRLVITLSAVPLTEGGEYQGNIGVWLDTQLLPALAPPPARAAAIADTPGPVEATLLAAISGLRTNAAAAPEVTWEGLRYRVDVGAAEFSRLARIRQKQGGHGFDAALAYCREVYHLPGALTSPAGVPARVTALTAAVNGLGQIAAVSAGSDLPTPNLQELLDDAVNELRTITKPKDLAKVERIATPLRRASDWLLATVLTSLAYAPHLGDPDGPALLAGDPAQRHSFGIEDRLPEARILNPWRLPQESFRDAGGWRVTGSVLGLDVGLARLALRRLATDSLPAPPSVNDIDRSAMAAAVVLSNPFDVTDAERDALADAVRRGRARINGLSAHPSALSHVVRVAQIGEWRQQMLPWAQVREPDRVPEYFSMADLVRVGEAEATAGPLLDTWGTSGLAMEGCLCLRYPGAGTWETLAGRAGTSLVVEQVPDLTLRVAESLANRALPARLVRAVMAVATQDALDAYRPAFSDDWAALVAIVRRVSDGRVEDYIAALTSGGPLVPVDRESPDDARR